MKWEDFRQSENIEDRRGSDYADAGGGGGGSSGHLGLGTMIVLGILGYALGIDPRVLIGGAEMVSHMSSGGSQQQSAAPSGKVGAPKDRIGQFVAAIIAQNEDVWKEVLPQQANIRFTPATVVMFNGQTRSACGKAKSAMGPFYCPEDKKIYLDTSFFREMKQKFGGGGDFAYAYVISHEMGHHIQNLLGSPVEMAGRPAERWRPRRRPTPFPCASNCRPTASPASGPPTPTRNGRCWSRATSRRRSLRRSRSATTSFNRPRAAKSCRIPSPTARRRSACNGCNAA